MRRRRNFRKKVDYMDSKVITLSLIGVLVLATVVFGILMYGKNIDDNVRGSQLSPEQIASITGNDENNSQSASTDIGKSVEEAEKEALEEKNKNNITTEKQANAENIKTNSVVLTNENTTSNKATTNPNLTSNKVVTTTAKTTKKEETKKELSFKKPVEGEIICGFAKDNLVFSKTLEEWVTHLGIDIKSEKTTVVQAAEDGIVKSIKNDPRYGLTIVISHQDGFETVYANLLSSEFVKEGDKVIKGQSIGTVGNTGVFESVDEPHLHFEILKDSVQVDPSIYLK